MNDQLKIALDALKAISEEAGAGYSDVLGRTGEPIGDMARKAIAAMEELRAPVSTMPAAYLINNPLHTTGIIRVRSDEDHAIAKEWGHDAIALFDHAARIKAGKFFEYANGGIYEHLIKARPAGTAKDLGIAELEIYRGEDGRGWFRVPADFSARMNPLPVQAPTEPDAIPNWKGSKRALMNDVWRATGGAPGASVSREEIIQAVSALAKHAAAAFAAQTNSFDGINQAALDEEFRMLAAHVEATQLLMNLVWEAVGGEPTNSLSVDQVLGAVRTLREQLATARLDEMTARWHAGAGRGKTLQEFLGMTGQEYAEWIKNMRPPDAQKTAPTVYTREQVQQWRNDIAHTAADIAQRALGSEWEWLVRSIRSMARAPRNAPVVPRTPEEAIGFIGSQYSAMRLADEHGKELPKADVSYTLSVHDLLSAFSMAGFYDADPVPPLESDKGEITQCPYCGNRAYEEDIERPTDYCHHEVPTEYEVTDSASLGDELEAVLREIRSGRPLDATCVRTIQRVRDALAEFAKRDAAGLFLRATNAAGNENWIQLFGDDENDPNAEPLYAEPTFKLQR